MRPLAKYLKRLAHNSQNLQLPSQTINGLFGRKFILLFKIN